MYHVQQFLCVHIMKMVKGNDVLLAICLKIYSMYFLFLLPLLLSLHVIANFAPLTCIAANLAWGYFMGDTKGAGIDGCFMIHSAYFNIHT